MINTIYYIIFIFILTHLNIIFIYSFILRMALICFCTWTLVVAYSQTEHNTHSHCCLKKINYIFFLLLFSFTQFARLSFGALLSSLFHFAFALLILWTLCGRNHWNTQNPHLNIAPYAMFAPVVSHAIILSIGILLNQAHSFKLSNWMSVCRMHQLYWALW